MLKDEFFNVGIFKRGEGGDGIDFSPFTSLLVYNLNLNQVPSYYTLLRGGNLGDEYIFFSKTDGNCYGYVKFHLELLGKKKHI